MKVNIDYGRDDEQKKLASNQFLTRDYIEYAMGQIYKDNLKGQQLRQVARIQRKLDEAVKESLEEVNFEEGDMEFLRDVIEKTTFNPQLAKFVVCLQDELKK